MSHILFLNKCWGVDFMLLRRLTNEGIVPEYVSLFDDDHKDTDGLYKKYDVRSTPCLLVLDNELEVDRLKGLDEIVDYLKNAQNTKI